jgi:hypothetical protein
MTHRNAPADSCSVMIHGPQPNVYAIQLSEIQLYSLTGQMIDRYQLSAWQSSDLDGYPARQAIDGDVTTISSTRDGFRLDANPRLRVWYPCPSGTTSVSRVVVVQREDCCQDRLLGFQLNFLNAYGRVDRPSYFFTQVQAQYDIAVGAWLCSQRSCQLSCRWGGWRELATCAD